MREQPLWQLLAALKAPAILAVLRAVFPEGETALPGSLLHERVARELAALREAGEELPQAAALYVADWLRQGWLLRRLPEAASEETYELSVEAATALRFVAGLAALDAPSGSTPLAAPTATAARAEAAAPSVPLAAATALPVDTEPTQLDIFADSDDVRRRNDFIEATLADDAERAQSCLRIWREAQPADALVAEAQALVEHLGAEANEPAREAATAPAVLDARSLLEQQVGPAAARVLGGAAGAWMTRRWRALAARARLLPWQPALAEGHAASLWLRAQDWAAASAAVAGIESWRRIPQPLLWMAEARWHADGADAAWPLLAEAFWLAPARARALLERLADRRLLQAMQRFEDDFDSAGEADWAWWPAWLAIEQPLLAPTLAAADGSPDSEAAAGFRLVGALLRMEREGRHHEIVAARKQLRALQPRLFACYMRTR
ncbi:MAG: DUF3375 family protein [Rubrivivax sp.]